MKFSILITATLEVTGDEIKELREELGVESGDSLLEALRESLNDNLTELGIAAGTTEIGAVEVKQA